MSGGGAQPPDLLDLLEASWPPAERRALGGWTLRRGGGGGSRVSSVRVAGEPDRPLDAALAAVVAQARGWGQPALVQIGPQDAALDHALDERGWTRRDPTRLLAAPATAVAAKGVGGRMVVRVRTPVALVENLWTEGGVDAARRACMARVTAQKETLLLREADRPAALVFVAAPGPVAMLHALHVAPRFRRRGVGAAATAAAAQVALEMGAETLALAVTEANAPARAFYAALGFRDAGGYHYRAAPEDS